MCLLMHQPKGLTLSKYSIKDFVDHNPDGFGIMYGDGRRLRIEKVLGNADAVSKLYYAKAAGREAVLHFRMKTHGPVNFENVHPFLVTPKIGMAHNGILGIGNPKDESKTDTWHLIEYFVRPVARSNPDLLFDPQWCEMLGDLIGSSNKLAFCHADGRISLVNESGGVKHKGAWYSNTYAWSAPSSLKAVYSGYSYRGASNYAKMWEWVDEEEDREYGKAKGKSSKSSASGDNDEEINEWFHQTLREYNTSGTAGLSKFIERHPERAKLIIHSYYEYTLEEVQALVQDYPDAAVQSLEAIILEVSKATEDFDFGDGIGEEPEERTKE